MSAAKKSGTVVKIAKFSSDAEGGKQAKTYLLNVCKEGGWDSWEEFLNCYVFPTLAKRLDALERWSAANGKTAGKTAAKKKSAKKSTTKVAA